jgi:hypothetical protein
VSEYSEDLDDLNNDEQGEEKDYRPPGAEANHDMHDVYHAVKETAEHHLGRQEPNSPHAKFLSHVIDDAKNMMDRIRAHHEKHYDDSFPLADEEEESEDEGEDDEGDDEEPDLSEKESAEDEHPLEDVDEEDDDDDDDDNVIGQHRHIASRRRGTRKSRDKDEKTTRLARTIRRAKEELIELAADTYGSDFPILGRISRKSAGYSSDELDQAVRQVERFIDAAEDGLLTQKSAFGSDDDGGDVGGKLSLPEVDPLSNLASDNQAHTSEQRRLAESRLSQSMLNMSEAEQEDVLRELGAE